MTNKMLFAVGCLFVSGIQAQIKSEATLTLVGTTSLSTAAPASPVNNTGSEPKGVAAPHRTKVNAISGKFSAAPTLAVPLDIPNPAPLNVVGPDPGALVAPGLTILDDPPVNGGFLFEPPDQGLAVGNGFILEAVNLALAVFDATSGARASSVVSLNSFFGLPPAFDPTTSHFGPFVSDPKCYFDPDTQRWFITVTEFDIDPVTRAPLGPSSLLIAVSQTSNVFGKFNIFKINTTNNGTNGTQIHPGCPCFPDQPLIGADFHGFYVSTNEFPLFNNGFNGANIYAMSKWNLAQGALTAVVQFSGLPLADGLAFSVQPATSPTFLGEDFFGAEYFMSSLDFNNNLDNRIAVWAITNTWTLGFPHPDLALQSKVITSETYGFPPPAVQRPAPPGFTLFNNGGILELIDSNDDRMNQVVFANGYLWAGLNTIVGASTASGRPGIAYFIVKPSLIGGVLNATIAKQGYVTVAGDSTMYPSIGVTPFGNAAMVMTLVGPAGTPVFPDGFFPSMAYAPISVATGVGDIRLAAPGVGPDDSFTGSPARWGDYTAAVADWFNIWFAGERTSSPRFRSADWGTAIGRVP